jgi:hypothetical protein
MGSRSSAFRPFSRCTYYGIQFIKFYMLFITNHLSVRQSFDQLCYCIDGDRCHHFLSIYSCCFILGYRRCKVIILNSCFNLAECSSSTSLVALSVPISSQVPHSKVLGPI